MKMRRRAVGEGREKKEHQTRKQNETAERK
jgi:hypothetical protein